MRRLVLSTALSDLEAGILKEIPDIDILLDRDIPPAPTLEGKAGQQRLQLTIVDVLKRQSESLLILLEDLHWTSESLEPLKVLLVHIQDLPLLVLGTYRNDESPNLPDKVGDVFQLQLERLDTAAIQTLSASMLGAGGARPEVIELLHRETEGNVFFLVEVVRALAESAGGLNDIGQMTLPRSVFAGGVQEVIRRRLDKVPAAYRPLLNLATVAGRQLDLAILEKTRGDIRLNEWLVTCQDAAILEVREDTWRFSHDKLREALLQHLDEGARPELHRQIAEAIEEIYPDSINYHEALLEHWHQAGNLEREFHYLPSVSKHLVEVQADFQRARDLIERGLNRLPADDRRRIKLLNLLASSSRRIGNYKRAMEQAEEAKALAQQHDDQSELAFSLSTLGTISDHLSEYEAAKAYLQQSLEIHKNIENKLGMANTLNNLGNVFWRQGDYLSAHDCAEQSLALAEESNNTHAIARSFKQLGIVAYSQGNIEQAKLYWHKNLEMVRSLGSQQDMLYVLGNLGILSMGLDNLAEALEYFQQAREIAQSIGDWPNLGLIYVNLGDLKSKMGRFEEARAMFQKSIAIQESINYQPGIVMNLIGLGFIELKMDSTDKAISYFREALSITFSKKIMGHLLQTLVGFAGIYTKQNQTVRAAELLGLVKFHPALSLSPGMSRSWDTIAEEIQETLSLEAFEAAVERGKAFDLDQIVADILADFDENDMSS
ncbi:MAG: tetratricopeptide repeat protein [Chloroflexi bacterium]|nr:tetratricopeptide repeat protein [Chloroflexota bacterium]